MKERPILFSGPMVKAILAGQKRVTRRVVKVPGLKYIGPGQDAYDERDPYNYGIEDEYGAYHTLGHRCSIPCPYGQPGDRLWVREAHAIFSAHGQHRSDGKRWGPWGGLPTVLSPDGSQIAYFREGFDRADPGRWRPSIHMPRWASRLTLAVESIRVERLQSISEEDARAEGVEWDSHGAVLSSGGWKNYGQQDLPGESVSYFLSARESFESLWQSINGARDPGHVRRRARKGKPTDRYEGTHPPTPGPYSWEANPFVWVIGFKVAEARHE